MSILPFVRGSFKTRYLKHQKNGFVTIMLSFDYFLYKNYVTENFGVAAWLLGGMKGCVAIRILGRIFVLIVCIKPSLQMTYTCQPCVYHTTSKRDYERHLLTQKHLDGGNIGKTPIKTQHGYSCPICHNTYKSRTSTYTHINKCVVPITLHTTNTNTNTNTNTIPTISESNSFVTNQNYITEVITHNQELRASNQELRTAMLLLIQQNTDFQNKMLDICKKCSHS
jgi:hypothetical protein